MKRLLRNVKEMDGETGMRSTLKDSVTQIYN